MDGVEFRLGTPEGVEGDTGTAGELRIRGEVIVSGYLGLPEAMIADFDDDDDGWLGTGDLACRHGEGYYVVVNRLNDVVVRGGYNSGPARNEGGAVRARLHG